VVIDKPVPLINIFASLMQGFERWKTISDFDQTIFYKNHKIEIK